MGNCRHDATRAPFGLRALALAFPFVILLLALGLRTSAAEAAVVCPNPVPVVNENQCKTGTTSWQLSAEPSPNLGGYTTQTSVDLGESVTLKIARNAPVSSNKTVDIAVYRMGYYQGNGGRLVNSATKVAINNDFTCKPMDETTGEVDCGNWSPTYTIPGSALPASGVYIVKLTASTGEQTQVVFTVRDDERQPTSKILFVLPISTYEAYNIFGGKSLYYGNEGGNTVSGTSRAVKVSFNRPFDRAGGEHDWFFGPDFNLLMWMEKQGYDVSYTDDVHLHEDPASLLEHNTIVVSGHSEYWSLQQFKGFLAAREAGVNIASFSANTAYWKVRYEDSQRTLVCYKTVEGSGSAGSGSVGQNDWGPDGIKGTADDALGLDGIAGTADDNPQNSTTTFRDNGAPPGDPGAPPGGRVGPDMPENQLFGIMYVGDNDSRGFPITVPPANANEEFAGDRIWRNTGISENETTNIGSLLVNWEWDAIPTQPQYLAHEPSGVKRLYATNVQAAPDNSWIQDEGRLRNTTPPPGQPGTIGGVHYTAASGAQVFAAGTMQWSRGLSNETDERIQQATYNIFSDMGEQPNTPEEITLDPGGSNQAPNGAFTISQNPAKTSTAITFNAAISNDPDGTIAKYEWDLDGDGTFETNTGTKSSVTHSFPAEGTYNVRLRVTDNGGATDLAVRTITIIDNQPPTASFTATPNVTKKGEPIAFSGAASSDPDGTIAKYEWDFDGDGSYETNGGSSPSISHTYTTPGTYTVGLRVTDNGGKTATTTRPVSINSGEVSKYSDSVLATPGLDHYWRMGETAGPTFADSKGSSPATASGGTIFGVPGGVPEDPDRAAEFDGVNDAASAAVNLSGTHTVTVEFWLKWNEYANDDRLAMELTGNFNEVPGGFLVDPNAPQLGGSFGVGIGSGPARNNVFFERPSAGTWHHYAFVLNTAAPASQQITPYVDGKAIAYTKLDSGTGSGNFANSSLFMMSRSGTGLFGAGDLDEVAIYKRALTAPTIAKHYAGVVVNGDEGSVGSGEETGGGEEPPVEEEAGPGPGGTGASYTDAVLASPGLLDYWGMGEASGPTIADSVGSSPATASGGASFGASGGVPGETGSSVKFDGVDDAASAPLHLGGKTAITVEFWMKWNTWANNDSLAMEYTPNFNSTPGGFLVDPNSSYGNFAVALGIGSSRNVALFARPSAGTWHHYAFVLDTQAPAAQQIVPYVDGLPVSYTKAESGTGAGSFADSTLSFMSRGGSSLFGAGNLQDVAIFDHALSGATISGHYASNGASGRPVASFKAPATAKVGETVQFDASASKDLDGTIAKYEWDLDGNGSYETDTGTTPSASRSYASAGSVNIGLRVTDNSGNTSTAARTVKVESGSSAGADYKDAVLGTAGLVDYWRLDETSGSVFADSAGSSPAAMLGAPTLGVPGGVPGDSDTAARFNGSGDSASAALHLSGQTAITVEFWLKWSNYANDDSLAMEYTPNSNEVPGGFIVDPNSSYGSFAVGLGQGSSRNIALFARPSAGTWHHYAFVLDTTAPASEEVVPYVDGKAVAYSKAENGSGAPAFADAALTLMSRGGSGLFGAGDLDDVAIYDRPLSATTISDHYQGIAGNQRPVASFQAPASVKVGEKAQFDASASSDPDGTVTRYEWDLDGNGTYETSTGTTPTASRSYATAGPVTVGLRVTDDSGATAIASRTVTVQAGAGGGGEEETGGGSSTAYRDSVLGTPSLLHYWRLDEKSGSQLADSGGASPLSTVGEPILGVPGAIAGDPDTAARFDGIDDAATVPLQLSSKTAITVEFWLKWSNYANDDSLAMEYTPNFNEVPGGFLVDPNSSYGSFAVGLGQGASRNVALFARPSAGVWHHYAFVLDTTAPASEEVTPYVDGKAVTYSKAENGSGAPAFADAALTLMSRAGTALRGAGDLDDVAIYGSALSPSTVAGHYDLGAPNHLPSASFNAAPNPAATNATVNFNAGASSDPDGTIAKYEWDLDGNGSYETDSGTSATTSHSYATPGDRTVGLRITDNRGGTSTAAVTVTVQNQAPVASFTATPNPAPTGSAITLDATASSDPDGTIAKYEWDLDGNGSYETSTGTTPTATTSFASQGSRAIGLRVTDNSGATATTTRTVTIQNRAPVPVFTATPNPVVSGQSVTFNAAASSDPDGTVAKYEWDLDSDGSYETNTGTTATVSRTFTTPGNRVIGLRVTDNSGATATTTQTVTVQNRVPTASFTATPTTAQTGVAIAFNAAASSDPDGTIAKYEWDFDGNGTYETDAGAAASASHAFPAAGTITVGLRVTDNSGGTATTTRTVTIQNSPPTASFTATPNPVPTGTSVAYNAGASVDPDGTITKYEWDLDGNGTYETSTGTSASASSSYATVGARTVHLRVTDNSGATTIATQTVTVTNRAPVPSFTISANPVQSLVNVTLNASASKDPDGTIAKYEWDLDGDGTYEVNAGTSASTTRSFATSGERLVGLRVTDNLGETATTTVKVNVTNRAPTASFTASPSSVPTGTNTTLSAAASSDPDGTIAKYEWDLDNNGSYETSTGATSSLVTSFATAGTKTVGLRVTDNSGATATTTRTVTVTNRAPTASFTASPNPVAVGATVSFNAGASVDPDGTITKYEWDLDGNGTYETSTGTTPTTTKTFTPAGTKTIGLRVTDNSGATGTTTQTVTVRAPYNTAVSSTPGLIDYWRLGETSGTTLANSVTGAPSATTRNTPTLGIAGPLSLESNTAISFDGGADNATASLNLSGDSTVTIEFWLKWNTFANNDDLAFEFTSNFNNTNGGFLVNPNSSTSGGKFEVALGRGTSRNNAYFTRPSAGAWHHYAIVLNTTAAAAQQIVVYVDGSPVSITKGSSGTGAGNFANSTLSFMSRNGTTLFGAGTLDEVALYNQALTATQVSQHFAAK